MSAGIEPVLLTRARLLVAESTGFREDAISAESLERALRAELSRGRTTGDLLSELQRPDSELSLAVVRATLVGETYFFRHPEHFRFIAREAVPSVLRTRPRRIRGWSAGCATGEEAYSLAACLLACSAPGVTVEVLGTDLHDGSLASARRAIYGSWSRRESGPHLFPLYRSFGDKQVIVIESVRSVTTFMLANLLAPLPGHVAPFDFVLCRNVLTYFSAVARDTAIANIVRSLSPGGYLFLGTVEVDRPPPGVVRVGPPELQAFQRPLHPEASAVPAPKAPSRTGLPAIPAVAFTPPPLPPRRPPKEAHLEALRHIEEGNVSRATAQLEELVKQWPDYLPGLLELALLRERSGSRSAAYPLMRAVYTRAARLPPDQLVEGPEALPARFYKASADAYLNQGAAE